MTASCRRQISVFVEVIFWTELIVLDKMSSIFWGGMFASIWGRCSWNGLRLKVLTKLNCWWTIWTVWLTCFVCFVVSRLVLFHCLKIWNFDEPGSFVIGPPGWFFITCFVWLLWFSGEKYDCWKLLAALTLVDARSSYPYKVSRLLVCS